MSTISVSAKNLINGQQGFITLNRQPDQCPICHHAIEPAFRIAFVVVDVSISPGEGNVRRAQVVYHCPRRSCYRLFIASYSPATLIAADHQISSTLWQLTSTEPRVAQQQTFSDEIAQVSPGFVSIFNQAKAAEDFNLPDVAGPGYRKALEFLVKEYLIDENPGDADAIKKEQLSNVIANRVTDPRVKGMASRASWLGNDETHYERRWKDKDIQDLKQLVRLTVIWVESCVLSRRLEQDMLHPSKARAMKD